MSNQYIQFSIIQIALSQYVPNTGWTSDLVRISEQSVNQIVLHTHVAADTTDKKNASTVWASEYNYVPR